MKIHITFAALCAFTLFGDNSFAVAGETISEAGALGLVTDKWDEKEVEKGHKIVDYAGRYVAIPDDPAAAKSTGDCKGKYEYMPDGSWKGAGTCAVTFKDEGTLQESWEEGSQLKEYTYKWTGGTDKFKGATGGGTYTSENLTDTLGGGKYKGTIVLP